MELSVVIPCLNEEETIGICLKKATSTLDDNRIEYEIIVADNGSADSSVKIALSFPKVKVIPVEKKGYGITLKTGIAHAQGKYILMADADDSYDFGDVMKFINKIRSGYQLVQGCRFPSGGGTIMEGAMPISHKIFGNPFLSKVAQVIYDIPFKDIYCGMRCFEKEIYLRKNYFSDGMTFAVENLIKLYNSGAKCAEVPIILYKDGRIKNKSHLKTMSDGLRTLKLLLICSPKWLYFYPSFFLLIFALNESYNFILNYHHTKNLEIIEYIKATKVIAILMLSLQIFSLGVFTSLVSYQIGLQKKNILVKMVSFFNLKSFISITFIATISVIWFISSGILTIDENFKYFVIFNSIIIFIFLFFNALFISLLELVKFEKE
jgi:glycosyltransferase involved in cell wall biosynthesis